MNFRSPARIAATWGLACLPLLAGAATDVYTQAPNGNFTNVSAVFNVAGDPGFTWSLDQDDELWAYFSAPASASFSRISWYGSNTDGNFAVDFFAASCFSCGINVVATDGTFSNSLLPNPGPFSPSQVHKTLVSGNLYAYSIDLTASLTLVAGSAYALSIVNNYTALPFVWAGSNTGSGRYAQYVVGQAMVLPAPGNLAFTLTDTTAAVPEAATPWTLGLGALAVLGLVRRARSRV